jgi:hypothetical protein
VSTKEEPHYPAENPKDLLQENSLVRRENIKMRIKIWGSLVDIAAGCGMDDRSSGVRFPAGIAVFLFSTSFRPIPRPTQPRIQWVPAATSPGVKGQGCEADHSPPSSAEVKAWSYTFTSIYVFMSWYLIKHRDSFTFTF